jgi:hypothetical protein
MRYTAAQRQKRIEQIKATIQRLMSRDDKKLYAAHIRNLRSRLADAKATKPLRVHRSPRRLPS